MPLTREQVLAVLEEGPPRIAAAAADAPARLLRATDGEGEWTAGDVLAHMRASCDAWGECIATILTQPHPTIRAINPRAWIERTNYRRLAFGTSLRAFTEQRAELLALLKDASPKAWMRTATITGAGAPLVRTVHDYAERLARHERSHVKHMERLLRAGP